MLLAGLQPPRTHRPVAIGRLRNHGERERRRRSLLPYPFGARLRFSSMPAQSEPPASLAASLRSSWQGFLDTYEPLRSQLYRYCRHLTRSAWDAEDLAQEAMARAFGTLGQ